MGAFGITAAAELGLTRTQKAHLELRGSFDRVLDLSQGTPVLMYDVARSTAWLVPGSNVVLYIVRSWFLERTDLADGEIQKLPSASISADGGQAAINAITSHRELEFERQSDAAPWRFMDIVKDSVRILKACRTTKDRTQSSGSVSWLLSWIRNPRLYGWDLADMIDARDTTLRKEVAIQNNADDRWISSIGNHPNMLVLFCRNLDRPIRPRNAKEVCSTWTPIPSGKNYLVASVQCLKDLARHCEGYDRDLRLTEKCYWSQPQGSRPFKPCNFKSKSGCNRLQHVVTANPTRPLELKPKGAVIFGTAHSLERKRCRRAPVLESDDSSEEIIGTSEKVFTKAWNSSQTKHSGPPTPHSLTRSMSQTSSTDEKWAFETQTTPALPEKLAIGLALAQKVDFPIITTSELNTAIDEGRALYEELQRHRCENEKLRNFISTLRGQLDGWHQTNKRGPNPESSDEEFSEDGETDEESID